MGLVGAVGAAESVALCACVHAAQLAKINTIAAACATNRGVDITPPSYYVEFENSVDGHAFEAFNRR